LLLLQGDLERSLKLPVSPFCDRGHKHDYAKSQQGFLDFICLPSFNALRTFVDTPGLQVDCVDVLKANRDFWLRKSDERTQQLLDVTSHQQ
jgi:hypothetical protein